MGGPSVAVQQLMPLGNGQVLALGTFGGYGGSVSSALVRINADGTADPTYKPLPDPAVSVNLGPGALRADGTAYLTSLINVPGLGNGYYLHRFFGDGSRDTSFNPFVFGNISFIEAAPDGSVFLAGAFTQVNGVSAPGIARVLPDGNVDPAFNAPAAGITGVNRVLAQPNGKLIVMGSFSGATGLFPSAGVARLNGDGSVDRVFSFIAGIGSSSVNSAALFPDGRVVIGGGFTQVNGVARASLAILQGDSIDPAFTLRPFGGTVPQGTNVGSYVVVITNSSGAVTSAPVLVSAPDHPGVLITNWASGIVSGAANFTDVLALPDGKFFVAGNNIFGNAPYFNRLNSDGSVDAGFNAGLASGVGTGNLGKMALTPGNGRIYLQRAAALQRHNATNGTLDASFNFRGISGTAVPGIADFAVAPDGKVVIGGSFTNYGGFPVTHIARLNPEGTFDGGFYPSLPNSVTAGCWSAIPSTAAPRV